MKRNSFLIFRLFNFCMVAVALLLTACDDISQVEEVLAKENMPNAGAPVISKVMMANDVNGTVIESAAFTQVVRIEGKNLNGVTSVRFNDVEADASEIYSRYDAVIAKVPRVLPQTVTDMVYVTTGEGTVSAPLKITIPELKIQGLYCEYAQPGDTTYIQGNDYDLYGITAEEAIIKVGDKDVNVLAASNDELMIQIPSNCKLGDPISIQGSKMQEPVYIDYAKPGVSMLFNWNDWPGTGAFTHASKYDWAPTNFLYSKFSAGEDDPKPLGDNGKYIRFKDDVGAWGWMVFWAGYIDIPEEVAASPKDYELRFEFWNDNKYPLNSTYRIIFGSFQWYPGGNGIPLNTKNQWKTIRIPLDEVDPEGNVMVPEGTDPSLKFTYSIILSPTAAVTYNIAMTNFRFVKK